MGKKNLDQENLDKVFEGSPDNAQERLKGINGFLSQKEQAFVGQGKSPLEIIILLFEQFFNASYI